MDLYVLDASFAPLAYVEKFDSAIWSLRYSEAGDFEIHAYPGSDLYDYLRVGTYVLDEHSRTAMFIEELEFDSDSENGLSSVFKGRSLESMLERRIIWRKKIISGKLQDIIQGLLNDNIIDPKKDDGTPETDRKISNFVFQASSDSRLDDYKIDSTSPIELFGDNLYDTVKYLCDLFDVGFRITLDTNNRFIFELYCGEVLDGSQSDKPTVEFSPKMDNLASSRYYNSSKNYKNITKIVSTYEFKADQDARDPQHETEQSNDSSSAIAASIIDGSTLTTLTDGLCVSVKFHKKVSAGASLNVAGTGLKPIYKGTSPIGEDMISGSATKKFTYRSISGGRWLLDLETYEITASTPSWVVFPSNSSELYSGLKIAIKFNKKVSANATLNINGSGAKPLYYNGKPVPDELVDGSAELVVTYNTSGSGRWDLSAPAEGDPPIEQSRVLTLTDNIGEDSGLSRREIFTDANNITTEDGMTPEDYAESMRLQGYATLKDNRWVTEIDGESIPDVQYVFGKDFNIGDIVKTENEFGIVISARVTEYVQTIDENGPSACPTFSSVYS